VAEFIATGRIVDLIAGLMLLEMGVLTIVRWRIRRGVPPTELAVALAAGMALLLALRAALRGLSWQQVSMWLIVALVAHVAYLKLRWVAR
jgi:hypothetical protein